MPRLPDLTDRRFVLVTGKGGVGKTTVAALLAQQSAASGLRTLVCELNAHERIPAIFGRSPVGEHVTPIADNLWSVNIRPQAALEEYVLMKLRFRAIYRLVFENPLVQRFVQFVPGMNDLLLLGKTFNHEREMEGDAPRFDRIIIDAPATGHGMSMLRLPKVICDAVPAGNMHDEAAAMWALLTDPIRTAVHLVTLPEELPVQETRELAGMLRSLGLPLGYLFLNQVAPPLLSAPMEQDLEILAATRPTDPALGALWEATRIRLGRVSQSVRYRAELVALGLPIASLPMQYARRFGQTQLTTLADAFTAQVEAP